MSIANAGLFDATGVRTADLFFSLAIEVLSEIQMGYANAMHERDPQRSRNVKRENVGMQQRTDISQRDTSMAANA
ncbi:hypothetical protein [Paraburkholderia sp. C35]|uniref:hypothetical protein n=1 Tax=Paraburkholderia sp. C35 TaxID=2126993 RepID=UPI000D685E67|nr:hypothetical protein [Paraburkholderia sp. C35]